MRWKSLEISLILKGLLSHCGGLAVALKGSRLVKKKQRPQVGAKKKVDGWMDR